MIVTYNTMRGQVMTTKPWHPDRLRKGALRLPRVLLKQQDQTVSFVLKMRSSHE